MPRRVTLALVTAASVAAAPAAAQAATFTVDAAAADGCAGNVCKTVTQAVAAVADGDTITVKPGAYKEAGKVVLTKKNVNIVGTPGRTTIFPNAVAAGDATLTIIEGTILDGITVATTTNSGPAVLVTGRNTTVKNSTLLRLAPSTQDAPAYAIDDTVAAGTSTIQTSTVINGPAGAATQTQPAVRGGATSTLALAGAFVISGVGNGPAVGITGNDKNPDSSPIANTIVRSTLLAQKPAGDAVTVTSAADSALKKALTLDTTSLLSGSNGTALRVTSETGALPAPTAVAGDIKVVAKHVTIAGGDKPFAVAAQSAGNPAAGSIDVTFDRSIVHGKGQGTVSSFTPALPIPALGGVANTAKVAITTSDTTQNAVNAPADNASVTVAGKTTTPDAQLFVDLGRSNVHLRQDAPVIDKGGAAIGGESTTDIDGQPRQSGAATDLGADEFVNLKPTASATATPNAARQGATIAFDGSKSFDPEAASGGGIAKFIWVFGDGTTQETTTPTVTHVYDRLGLYNATLTVVDNGGLSSNLVAISTVAITDGTAPVVRITAPTAKKVFRIFVTKTFRRDGRTVKTTTLDKKRLAKVVFAGKATDATGIKSVQLSIRRVKVAGGRTSTRTCVFLDGKTTFKSASCKKPVFFSVQQKAGAFIYKLKSTLKPKAGTYEMSARATDGSGLVSAPVKVTFTLK